MTPVQLPEVPAPQKECWIGHELYTAAQLREYATEACQPLLDRIAKLEESESRWRAEWQASLGWRGAVVHGTRKNIDTVKQALLAAPSETNSER